MLDVRGQAGWQNAARLAAPVAERLSVMCMLAGAPGSNASLAARSPSDMLLCCTPQQQEAAPMQCLATPLSPGSCSSSLPSDPAESQCSLDAALA